MASMIGLARTWANRDNVLSSIVNKPTIPVSRDYSAAARCSSTRNTSKGSVRSR